LGLVVIPQGSLRTLILGSRARPHQTGARSTHGYNKKGACEAPPVAKRAIGCFAIKQNQCHRGLLNTIDSVKQNASLGQRALTELILRQATLIAANKISLLD
jgi:hypothetical protein